MRSRLGGYAIGLIFPVGCCFRRLAAVWHDDCVARWREAAVSDLLATLGTPFFAVIDFALDRPFVAATASMLATLIVVFVVLS